jgi:3-oxoacyl-ACP reductase-like protein
VQHSTSNTAATTAAAIAAAAAAVTAVVEALYKPSERLLMLIEKGLGSRAAACCLKHEKKRRSPGNKTIQVQLLLRLFPLFCVCVCASTVATAEPAATELCCCCYENC